MTQNVNQNYSTAQGTGYFNVKGQVGKAAVFDGAKMKMEVPLVFLEMPVHKMEMHQVLYIMPKQ